MTAIGVIGIFLGIIFFFVAVNSESSNSASMRNGAIIMFIGGMFTGVFGNPSSDLPDGMPVAAGFGIIAILFGGFFILRAIFGSSNQRASLLPVIITVVMSVVMLIAAFTISSGSPSKDRPWEELGVSENEYNKVYNHYKYGTPID